jgi:hypothetical protein
VPAGVQAHLLYGGAMIRKIDWLHHALSHQLAEHLHEFDLIQEPFSEHQILALQEKFLTNGFQYIKVKSVVKGRLIIEPFLASLGIYTDIAVLSTTPILPQAPMTDIYYELSNNGYISTFEPLYLDEFFIESFYHDFMWIEATRDVLNAHWFDDIKRKIIDIGIDQHIPILIVLYQDE